MKVRPAGAGWLRSLRSGSGLRSWTSDVGTRASWPQGGVKLRAGKSCRVREPTLPLAARWPGYTSIWKVRGVPPCAACPSPTGAMETRIAVASARELDARFPVSLDALTVAEVFPDIERG